MPAQQTSSSEFRKSKEMGTLMQLHFYFCSSPPSTPLSALLALISGKLSLSLVPAAKSWTVGHLSSGCQRMSVTAVPRCIWCKGESHNGPSKLPRVKRNDSGQGARAVYWMTESITHETTLVALLKVNYHVWTAYAVRGDD